MFENSFRIAKFSGRNNFVEFTADSFKIGKVVAKFRTYDEAKASGARITGSIDIYFGIDEFNSLCQLICNRAYEHKRENAYNRAMAAGKPWKDEQIVFYKRMGGSENKDTKKLESRIFTIEKGMKSDYILRAQVGPGERKGHLIAPAGKAERYIMIGLSADDLNLIASEGIRAVGIYDQIAWKGKIDDFMNMVHARIKENIE